MKKSQLIALSLCAFLLIFGFLFFHSRLTVSVLNSGPRAVSDLTINYAGGMASCPILGPNKLFRFTPKPKGESNLNIQFKDSSGAMRSQLLDVYFESGYSGNILISIDDAGGIKIEDHARPL